MTYAYQAALWCDSCGEEIMRTLDAKGAKPDTEDWDSDDYPKAGDPGESDSPDHCDAGTLCLERELVPFHGYVGALLNDELTDYGRQYIASLNTPLGAWWRRRFYVDYVAERDGAGFWDMGLGD